MAEKEVTSSIEELLPPNTKTKPKQQNSTPKKLQKPKPLPELTPQKATTKSTPQKPTPEEQNTTKSTTKVKPGYKYMGKQTIGQFIKKHVSKNLIPTERFATILGVIFLGVVLLALVQFPFARLLSGDVNIVTEIGYPLNFLELSVMDPGETPLLPKNLALDMTLYLLLSYLIDILINFILNSKIIESKEETKKRPKIYKDLKPSKSNKVIRKVVPKKTNLKQPQHSAQPSA